MYTCHHQGPRQCILPHTHSLDFLKSMTKWSRIAVIYQSCLSEYIKKYFHSITIKQKSLVIIKRIIVKNGSMKSIFSSSLRTFFLLTYWAYIWVHVRNPLWTHCQEIEFTWDGKTNKNSSTPFCPLPAFQKAFIA